MAVRRPSPRAIKRGLSVAAILLALVGAGLIAYPFATDLWAARLQYALADELEEGARAYRAGELGSGDALTRLQIPKLDVDVIVVEGTSLAALRAGAGHYPRTALPGEPGNVAIAGHRTTYGRPFRELDSLVAGDKVVLTTPIGRHVYEVTGRPWIVAPDDWSVVTRYPKRGSFLTLTSCHPEGSAAYRIVARARLVRSSGALASQGAGA